MKKISSKYIEIVGHSAHPSAVRIIDQLEDAYRAAHSSAAGFSNYCEETPSTRKCEKQLVDAENAFNSIV